MSTLSLRKIKHDSSAVDNITLEANGNVGVNGGSVNTVSSGLAINNPTATNYPGLEIQTAGVTRLFLNANNAESYVSATGTNPLAFYTNGNRRMTINASGHVTTPAQPAFYAYISGGAYGTTTTPIPWNNAPLNRGSCYSTSTYRFTAPVSGVYLFSSSVLTQEQASGNYAEIYFVINGATDYNRVQNDINSGGSTQITNTALIQLSANDYVTVKFYGAGAANYYSGGGSTPYSFWSGYLVG